MVQVRDGGGSLRDREKRRDSGVSRKCHPLAIESMRELGVIPGLWCDKRVDGGGSPWMGALEEEQGGRRV